MWRSVPQIPVLWTRIRTSLIPISGSGTSSSRSPSPGSALTSARMSSKLLAVGGLPGDRRIEDSCSSTAIELRRPSAVPSRELPGRHEESGGARHLPMEVARIELCPPDRLVDEAELGDRELIRAEGSAERRVLE